MRTTSSLLRFAASSVVLWLCAFVVAAPLSAQTGKITGVVTDAATGQPIEGAQVVVQGTGYGAMTQANGRYFILAVPPGAYNVQARRIGYQTTQTNTTVLIDVTRELNFQLSSAAAELAAVRVVETTQPLVELQQTGTTTQMTAVELEALPVRSINDALTLQTGFQEVPLISTDLTSFTAARRTGTPPILIRGGRAGETMTLIDGIPVNNFLFGGPTLSMTRKAVANIATFKGGFEPQYGNALSGIVSIATREGGQDLAGSVEYETSRFGGAIGSTPDELRDYDFVEGFLSGPVPATANRLRFVVAGRTQNEAATVLQYDDRVTNPFVEVDTFNRFEYRADLIPGWRAQGFNAERDLFGKLSFLFTPSTKLHAAILHYERETMRIPFDWGLTGYSYAEACTRLYQRQYGDVLDVRDVCDTEYDADLVRPGGRPEGDARFEFVHPAVITQLRDLYTLRFEQTVGRLNYNATGGFFDQRRGTCATFFSGVCMGERIADTNFNGRFVTPGVTSPEITPTEGTDEIAGNDKLRTWLARADAQIQATDHHNIGAGVFYQRHDVSFREVRDVGLNNIELQPSDYAAEPWDAAVYLQDRIEYDFVTLKIGARFDYGRAGGLFFNNPLDPTNGTTMHHVCTDPTRYGLPANWATFRDPVKDTVLTGLAACGHPDSPLRDTAVALAFQDDMGEAGIRRAFSPRLGISFPVTERSSMFFNFGVYYQNPLYNNVYQGTGIGTPLEGRPEAPALTTGTFVGNPQLRAEQTSSYEVGYVAEIGPLFSVQAVAWSKDQSGLTGIRTVGGSGSRIQVTNDPGATYGTASPRYTILNNVDFQTVRGVDFEFRRRLANFWEGRLSYGYSQASTNAAPPDLEEQQVVEEGDVPARTEIRSPIDQRHSATGTLIFRIRDETPSFPLGRLLRNSVLSTTARLNSGYPYTPALTFTGSPRDRLERFSGTAPVNFRIDVEAQKSWQAANVRYGAFVRVVNLMDRRNCVQVFATTGNCVGGSSPQGRLRAGNFTGESEGSTFFDRPHYAPTRRMVNAGIRLNF